MFGPGLAWPGVACCLLHVSTQHCRVQAKAESELTRVQAQHNTDTEELLAKFEDAQQLSAYVSTEIDSLTAQLTAAKAENMALSRHVETLRAAQQQVRPLSGKTVCRQS